MAGAVAVAEGGVKEGAWLSGTNEGKLAPGGRAPLRGRRARKAALIAEEAALRNELGIPDALLVLVQVRQGEAITGEDRGALWFDEGRLLFAGRRTSFGLFPADMAAGTRHRLSEGSSERPSVRLPLDATVQGRPVSLAVLALAPGSDPGMARTEYALRSWLAQDAAGEGQGPPLALAPDAPSPSALLARAVLATALWAASAALAGFLLLTAVVTCWGIPFAGLFLAGMVRAGRGFETPMEVWGAWIDRHRMGAG